MNVNLVLNHPLHDVGKAKNHNRAAITNRINEAIERFKSSSNSFMVNAAKSANLIISSLVRFCIRVSSGIRSRSFKHTKRAGSKQPPNSDGSDPDPETVSLTLRSKTSRNSSNHYLLLAAFFAYISINEVAK
ncbi:TPA: hypothetical protein LSH87_000702 [Citrobacter koseri]|uniref:hypothetical protein n=1 Tax=Citrobacter koseri TaxID=545 RepID=UPI0023B0805D|nr:hypothetical protein [Citrobacter koseri]HBL6926805.1 hypothetical protein [Citrobacter koseri]HBL6927772.1 hypothetical protein [Citrobacter koseri]